MEAGRASTSLPVLGTVLAVTEKRVKIEAEEDEGKVIRYVLPRSIEHHAPPPKPERKPSGKSTAGRSKRSGRKPAAGRSKRLGGLVVWSGGVSRPPEGRGPRGADQDGDRRGCLRRGGAGVELVLLPRGEAGASRSCARCVEEREVSPLSVGDEVEVVGMPPERECEREMFVSIDWGERTLAVPLAQLEVVKASKQTREAVEDWHYWVGMGYCF